MQTSLPTYYTTYCFYTQNFKTFASFCSWAAWFESYLVANPWSQIFSWNGFILFICFSDRGVDRTEVMRGSLHYLFDAVMPFLQVRSCVAGLLFIWAMTWQNQQNEFAPSEDSDQPGHPPSLIRVFAVRMKKAWVLSYPLSTQRRLWSDWADAQADLSLCWAHIHFVGFVISRLICPHSVVSCFSAIPLARRIRIAERNTGSWVWIPLETRFLSEPKRRFVAQRPSYSSFHCPDMSEIQLLRMKYNIFIFWIGGWKKLLPRGHCLQNNTSYVCFLKILEATVLRICSHCKSHWAISWETCLCHMRTTKLQISLRIRAVWSSPLLFTA